LFPFPGSVSRLNASDLKFTPLARTGEKTGTVRFGEIMQMTPFGPRGGLNPNRRQFPTSVSYVLAAHIEGKVKIAPPADEAEKKDDKKDAAKKEAPKPREANLNVILVSDIDMLAQDFFRLREEGDAPERGISFNFDNVTFVLNVLDELTGDERFVEIRKRRPHHRTLARIEEQTKEARQEATDARDQSVKDFEADEQKQQQAILDKVAELKKRKDIDPQQMMIEVAMTQQDQERQREAKTAQRRQEKDQKLNKIETELRLKVQGVQFEYKMWAVLLPPIPPLLVAVIVFFTRRRREREGVAQSRLR
jgi:ABC-2 type transport system permease protein